jgi:hypothetical protein
VILVVLALIALTIAATRKSRTFSLNQTLQFDDFCFTVLEAGRFTPDSAHPQRAGPERSAVDYLVRLKVDNNALRVPFKFGGKSLAIVDAAGKHARVWPAAERSASGSSGPPALHVLKAGESLTFEYLFTLPPSLTDPRLRIAPGGWSGDVLEWLVFGRKEFQLPW